MATAIATGWPGCDIERIAIAAARVVLVQKVENLLLESPKVTGKSSSERDINRSKINLGNIGLNFS